MRAMVECLVSGVALAQPRWELNWRSPESCLPAAELSAGVEKQLGRSVFAENPELVLDGALETGSAPKWKAHLVVKTPAGVTLSEKDVSGDDENCRALDSRLVFAAAMLVENQATAPVAPPSPPMVATPPAKPRAAPAPNSVWVEIEGDKPGITLTRHVGTAFGFVGGQSAIITAYSRECAAPCAENIVQPGDSFWLTGQGMVASQPFTLLGYPDGVKLKVKGGSVGLRVGAIVMMTVGIIAMLTGGAITMVGALLNGSESTLGGMKGVEDPYSTKKSSSSGSFVGAGVGVLAGGAALLGGSIPMFVFSSTKVEFFPLPRDPETGKTARDVTEI